MRYTKIPIQPKRAGKGFVLFHVAAIAVLLTGSVILADYIPLYALKYVVFVCLILAAFALLIHLVVRLSWNKTLFDPSDPSYEPEWLTVTEQGIEFKEKVPERGFRYDTGRLLWQDITWIRTNTVYVNKERRTDAVIIYAKKQLSPGSFLQRTTGDPTVQYIQMRGYDERAADDIKRYGHGKVKFELR